MQNRVQEIAAMYGADWHWYVRYDGDIGKSRWFNMTINRMLYKSGNCYKTEFEAKAHKDEWME